MAEPTQLFSDLADGRPLQARSVVKNTDGKAGIVHIFEAELVSGMLVVAKLNPLKGDVTSLQEIADGIGGGTPTLAVKTERRDLWHAVSPTRTRTLHYMEHPWLRPWGRCERAHVQYLGKARNKGARLDLQIRFLSLKFQKKKEAKQQAALEL